MALLVGLSYLGSELYFFSGRLGFPLDDAWIHLQFARQLAEGNGLAYNPGQWVTGSTAPLWTAILALGFALPGAAFLWWPKLAGLALFVLAVLGTDRLAGELGLARPARLLAGILVATSHWLAWASLSGMEVPLFTALALWAMVFHARERRVDRPGDPLADRRGGPRAPLSIVLFALGCLARPEGMLLLALALADRLLRVEEGESGELEIRALPVADAGRALSLSLVVLAPTLLFYWLVGGSILPTTFGAKAQPDLDLWPSLAYLRLVADIFFRSQPILAPAALGGIVALVATGRPFRQGSLLPAAWLLGQPLFYSVLASEQSAPPVGNFGRYYFPLIPVVVVLGLLGLEPLFDRARAGIRVAGRRRSALPLLATLLLAPAAFGITAGVLRYVQTVGNVHDSDVRAALWLRERLPESAVVGVQDAGAAKFFLPNSIVDLAGIVTPEIRPALLGRSDDPRFAPEVYWEERLIRFLGDPALVGTPPDYLLVFSQSYPAITSGAATGFRVRERFPIENNLAMAGDELVLVSTPWNRHPLGTPPGTEAPGSKPGRTPSTTPGSTPSPVPPAGQP